MVTSVLVSSKKPLVKSKDVIALNSPFTKMLYLTFPDCLFGAVAQSYLTCYLPGCSPHFATNKTQFTTLTWCSFFGQQREIKPMWKAPSLSPEIGLRAKRLYKQTLSLLYQFTTPNLNFFYPVNSSQVVSLSKKFKSCLPWSLLQTLYCWGGEGVSQPSSVILITKWSLNLLSPDNFPFILGWGGDDSAKNPEESKENSFSSLTASFSEHAGVLTPLRDNHS